MHGIQKIVATAEGNVLTDITNFAPLYDSTLTVAEADNFALRGEIPFMPLVRYPTEGDLPTETAIPIYDHKTTIHEHMGLLVKESVQYPDTYAVAFLPHPSDAPLPTHIASRFGKKNSYSPIAGFVLSHRQHAWQNSKVAIVDQAGEATELTRFQGKIAVAYLVYRAVKEAKRKYAKFQNGLIKTA